MDPGSEAGVTMGEAAIGSYQRPLVLLGQRLKQSDDQPDDRRALRRQKPDHDAHHAPGQSRFERRKIGFR